MTDRKPVGSDDDIYREKDSTTYISMTAMFSTETLKMRFQTKIISVFLKMIPIYSQRLRVVLITWNREEPRVSPDSADVIYSVSWIFFYII